jgi:hypothetical protein
MVGALAAISLVMGHPSFVDVPMSFEFLDDEDGTDLGITTLMVYDP